MPLSAATVLRTHGRNMSTMGSPKYREGGARGGASCTPALESFAKGRGGLGHRQRRRSSVRLAGAAARFEAVLELAQAPMGVPMKFRHRAGRAPHQQACPLSAHARLVVHPLARFLRPIEIVKRPVKFIAWPRATWPFGHFAALQP